MKIKSIYNDHTIKAIKKIANDITTVIKDDALHSKEEWGVLKSYDKIGERIPGHTDNMPEAQELAFRKLANLPDDEDQARIEILNKIRRIKKDIIDNADGFHIHISSDPRDDQSLAYFARLYEVYGPVSPWKNVIWRFKNKWKIHIKGLFKGKDAPIPGPKRTG